MSREAEVALVGLLAATIAGCVFLQLLTWFLTQLLTMMLLAMFILLTLLLIAVTLALPFAFLLLREQYHQNQIRTRLLLAEVKQKETLNYTVKRDEILYSDHANLTAYIPPHTLKHDEAIFHNGHMQQPTLLPSPNPTPSAEPTPSTVYSLPSTPALDPHWLTRIFSPDLCHALLIGARNSGKSTLFNRLMVNLADYWPDGCVTLLDPMFNKIDSGWLIPDGFQVQIHKVDGKGFIKQLRRFYASHQARADLVEVTRGGRRRQILAVDELPTLLKQLKSDNSKAGKNGYDEVMFMLRAIYSGGSHTEHSLILMSQTALVKDLDISESDKTNFIEVALQEQIINFLSRQRGLTGKKELYEQLQYLRDNHAYYAAIRSPGGVELQAVPDLSAWGAKRNYRLNGHVTTFMAEVMDGQNSEATLAACAEVMEWPL